MKNNPHKKYLAFSVIFLLFFCILFLSLYKGIENNNKITKETEVAWMVEIEKQNNIRTLNTSLKTISKEKILFDSHFTNNLNVAPFLDNLENLAKKVSAKAEVFSVEQIEKSIDDNFGLVIGIRVSGGFSAIYKFITLLENAPYELEIISMDIQRASSLLDKNVKLPKWNGNLQVKLLSFVP